MSKPKNKKSGSKPRHRKRGKHPKPKCRECRRILRTRTEINYEHCEDCLTRPLDLSGTRLIDDIDAMRAAARACGRRER